MRIKIEHNSAFTLLEILLSAVIFVLSVAGIFATLTAVRSPVIQKEGSLTAALYGKRVLEALRSQVSQTAANYYACSSASNPCPDFSLSVGVHAVLGASPGGLTWPPTLVAANKLCAGPVLCLQYTVTCADGSAGPNCTNAYIAHKVDLNIQY